MGSYEFIRPQIIVRCLICGEVIRYKDYLCKGGPPEICDKCKAAIMEMRKQMEESNGTA